jgi:hypothetical protein
MAGICWYRPDGSRARLAVPTQPGSSNRQRLIGVLIQLRRFPGRRARDLDLGQPARPPPPGDGAWLGGPAPLAPGRVPAGVCPRPGPGGGLWANLKGVELANLCPDTIAEVIEAAWQGIGRVRYERQLLFSFLRRYGLDL